MANFDVAFNWIMDFEDPQRECLMLPDNPPGSYVISGVNSHSFPTAFLRISQLPASERLPEIEKFYRGYFWQPGFYAQLDSDELAKRVFDAAVNMGSQVAVKLLQRSIGGELAEDGIWGPDTIDGANSKPENWIVAAFQMNCRYHYLSIVQHNMDDAKYLSGWLVRAQK